MSDLYSLEVHDRCESTMDLAHRWVKQQGLTLQKPHFIQCGIQLKGRGKGNRTWISEKGNFFGTLILPFPFDWKKGGEISFLAAVAIGSALETLDPTLIVQFKWPNDLMISEKKVGGLLLERLEGAQGRSFLSIGVGVNFISHPPDIPSTCLKDHMMLPSLDEFRELFITSLLHHYTIWINDGFIKIKKLWLQRALYRGNLIRFSTGKGVIEGVFQTINDQGGLVLKHQDKIESTVYTGDIF